MTRALVIAAPSSGAGKTLVSLGLMAAFRARGVSVRAAKSGPDYIDPAFHEIATGAPSVTLDAWAMPPETLIDLAARQGGDLLIVEAAMGVLDAAIDGRGSAADLAATLGAPIVLAVDAAKSGQSAALAPAGLRVLRPDLGLAGLILNRVGSQKHIALAQSLVPKDIPIFGAVPRDPCLSLPERHLGLVQACETPGISQFIANAAKTVEDHLDLDAIYAAAGKLPTTTDCRTVLAPLGQRIAVAHDIAFAFSYPHVLDGWRRAGAEVRLFSPLENEGPDNDADAVFLPGGYPELHATAIAAAGTFHAQMQAAAQRGATIYGECGGYMVLGDGLIDADGQTHRMLGLLPLETSFQNRKLTLGYRKLAPLTGPFHGPLMGHEFHYATITHEGDAPRLFTAHDAGDNLLGDMGLVVNNTSGSFAHLIAPVPAPGG